MVEPFFVGWRGSFVYRICIQGDVTQNGRHLESKMAAIHRNTPTVALKGLISIENGVKNGDILNAWITSVSRFSFPFLWSTKTEDGRGLVKPQPQEPYGCVLQCRAIENVERDWAYSYALSYYGRGRREGLKVGSRRLMAKPETASVAGAKAKNAYRLTRPTVISYRCKFLCIF